MISFGDKGFGLASALTAIISRHHGVGLFAEFLSFAYR